MCFPTMSLWGPGSACGGGWAASMPDRTPMAKAGDRRGQAHGPRPNDIPQPRRERSPHAPPPPAPGAQVADPSPTPQTPFLFLLLELSLLVRGPLGVVSLSPTEDLPRSCGSVSFPLQPRRRSTTPWVHTTRRALPQSGGLVADRASHGATIQMWATAGGSCQSASRTAPELWDSWPRDSLTAASVITSFRPL